MKILLIACNDGPATRLVGLTARDKKALAGTLKEIMAPWRRK
jgi:hypothetical protein